MWDLIVSVPNHCLSFLLYKVTNNINVVIPILCDRRVFLYLTSSVSLRSKSMKKTNKKKQLMDRFRQATMANIVWQKYYRIWLLTVCLARYFHCNANKFRNIYFCHKRLLRAFSSVFFFFFCISSISLFPLSWHAILQLCKL